MDWWQLINFDKPDNEFRVDRNIYRSVSVNRITLRQKRYPQEALQSSGIGGHNHPSHYNDESGWIQTPYFHYNTFKILVEYTIIKYCFASFLDICDK